jgi:hypothetical protein
MGVIKEDPSAGREIQCQWAGKLRVTDGSVSPKFISKCTKIPINVPGRIFIELD